MKKTGNTALRAGAFTLLELLIVITIIGVLTSILILDFVGVKQRQELSLMADQAVAMLQQARGEVGAGKVRRVAETAGTAETAIFLCEGVFFEEGEAPLFAIADYDAASGSCSNFETENYGLSTGGAFVSSIIVGDIGTKSVWVLYSPPQNELVFFSGDSGSTEVFSGNAVVHFDHSTAAPLDLSVEISSVTNLVTLSINDDEE